MKKTLICITIGFLALQLNAQDKTRAEKLVTQGVKMHDEGRLDDAIAKYNEALLADSNNYAAMAEKAMTLLALNQYQETEVLCEKVISLHPNDPDVKNVFVTLGNSLDFQGKKQDALEAYNRGLKAFPDYYQLHFNKGITLVGMEQMDEALTCLENAVICNPRHAGSHNAIGRIMALKGKRIPAIMALSRCIVLEPDSKRSADNIETLKNLMGQGVEKTGKKNITISLDPSMMGDTMPDGSAAANNFGAIELMLSMTTALDFDKKHKKESDVERFNRKMEGICAVMGEMKGKNSGFYWEYYAPYFIAIEENKQMESLSNIVFASSKDKEVTDWVRNHKSEIQAFYEWSKNFEWKK